MCFECYEYVEVTVNEETRERIKKEFPGSKSVPWHGTNFKLLGSTPRKNKVTYSLNLVASEISSSWN